MTGPDDERRREHADLVIEHILVGYDGSEPAKDALRSVARMAERLGASVTVAIVKQMPTMIALTTTATIDVIRSLDDWADAMRAEVAPLMAPVAHWDVVVREGHAPAELEAVAREKSVDLVVVGSRGHSPMYNAFIGSVANHLVNHSPVPVLVIR